jgi:hypothetical protein
MNPCATVLYTHMRLKSFRSETRRLIFASHGENANTFRRPLKIGNQSKRPQNARRKLTEAFELYVEDLKANGNLRDQFLKKIREGMFMKVKDKNEERALLNFFEPDAAGRRKPPVGKTALLNWGRKRNGPKN